MKMKMKKMLYWLVPVKSFAAMIFAGFIILYIVTGSLYAFITGDGSFEYSIPFIFAIQGAILSVIISVLWTIFFGDLIIKKMRYFLRLVIFSLTLLPVFGVCLLIFINAPTNWAKLWMIVAGAMVVGLIVISLLFESYFKLIGRKYTEILKDYKSNTK